MNRKKLYLINREEKLMLPPASPAQANDRPARTAGIAHDQWRWSLNFVSDALSDQAGIDR